MVGEKWRGLSAQAPAAVSVIILLHLLLPSVGVSIVMGRGCRLKWQSRRRLQEQQEYKTKAARVDEKDRKAAIQACSQPRLMPTPCGSLAVDGCVSACQRVCVYAACGWQDLASSAAGFDARGSNGSGRPPQPSTRLLFCWHPLSIPVETPT